jgi:hypothetical protein
MEFFPCVKKAHASIDHARVYEICPFSREKGTTVATPVSELMALLAYRSAALGFMDDGVV